MKSSLLTVITTVQEPTSAVTRLVSELRKVDSELIVIGDQKGPYDYDLDGTRFLSLAAQLDLDFELARSLPTAHYARKNIGYLEAIGNGASCIYETDDDNAPLDSWVPRTEMVKVLSVLEHGWINVYRLFSEERIWPRGFPLVALSN